MQIELSERRITLNFIAEIKLGYEKFTFKGNLIEIKANTKVCSMQVFTMIYE